MGNHENIQSQVASVHRWEHRGKSQKKKLSQKFDKLIKKVITTQKSTKLIFQNWFSFCIKFSDHGSQLFLHHLKSFGPPGPPGGSQKKCV